MEWNLNFQSDAVVEIIYKGRFSNEDFSNMIGKVVADPRWKPGMSVVADFRDVVFEDIFMNDVFTSVNIHYKFDEFIGDGKIAAIHSNENSIRLAKLYAEISGMMVKSKIVTFNDYDKAVDWINKN